jgi:hypothetical protein
MKKLFSRLYYHRLNKLLNELQLIRELTHSGEKGKESEAILREFLRTSLPEKLGIETGFAITQDEVSTQLDIMIYDKMQYPVIYSGYAFKILPLLSVFMAIEVKMQLTSANLREANNKACLLAKQFTSDLSYLANKCPTGNQVTTRCLFAFESELKIDKMAEILSETEANGVDLLFVLNQGILIKYNDSYSKIDINTIKWTGKSLDGFHITKSHKLFVTFLSYLFDKISTHNATPISYIQWHMRDSIYDDTDEQE